MAKHEMKKPADEMLCEWTQALTRIGRALGLEGKFVMDFGFQQIEERIVTRHADARTGSLAHRALQGHLKRGEALGFATPAENSNKDAP